MKNTAAHPAAAKEGKSPSKGKCPLCGEDHHINYCSKFSALSQEQRRSHAHSAKLCLNCLGSGHFVDACPSKGRCYVCNEKHHTKLHRDGKASSADSSASSQTSALTITTPADSSTSCSHATKDCEVLLSTICAVLQAPNGRSISVRALLDSGAESCFVSEHVAQALSLNKRLVDVAVSGIGGSVVTLSRGKASLILKSSNCDDFSLNFSALILKRLTTILPKMTIQRPNWTEREGMTLADPHFGTPGRIDCILSAEVYAAVIRPGIMRGPCDSFVAIQSVFGWILMGSARACSKGSSDVSVLHTCVDADLSLSVARFWETEEVIEKYVMSDEDKACFEHFKSTYSRDDSGRFILRLPFLKDHVTLNSYSIAAACFRRLEQRFRRQPQVALSYKNFMKEYEELGHMETVPTDEITRKFTYYLPHHPVFKNDGSGKIRVVFNASQKDSNGIALNSLLHSGPKLQKDVIAILTEWAFSPFVFTCDIVKMFRQFRIHPDDVDWLRFLWRSSETEPIRCCRLLTVTYGTACAPFQANASLDQLAEDVDNKFPEVALILRRKRFVDDFFVGGDSEDEITEIQGQLVSVLRSAGMEVGKWASNSPNFMAGLGEVDMKSMKVDDLDMVSTLGLCWSAAKDTFHFKITATESPSKVTKRSILSEISRLFDPIGWLAPIIIRGKILLQNLWIQGSNWDEVVSSEVSKQWSEFCNQLFDLEQLSIPRWVGSNKTTTWQLHCFCDASERAYAASIYVVIPEAGGFSSRLLAAKSKVAPIKAISLPRLELCGASLLAKLVAYLLPQWSHQPSLIRCWSDSKVVLAWLKGHPCKWQSFVANRVSDINSKLPGAIWEHVASGDNPADLASRGLTPAQLKAAQIWWEGPSWLKGSPTEWPSTDGVCLSTDLEARKGRDTHIFFVDADEDLTSWLSRFSSFDKIIRILAYVARWRTNYKIQDEERRRSWLTAQELAKGQLFLIRFVQRSAFMEEYKDLILNKPLKRHSRLLRLSPFLDRDGLIRVGEDCKILI